MQKESIMEFHLDDFVPNDLTDAQKKSTICEWFVRGYLDYANCFIRAELNHAPQNIKVTIEKPIDFNGELVDFADIVVEYETPEKLDQFDENLNKTLALKKSMSLNNLLKESVLSKFPQTAEIYDKKKTKSLFSDDYTAPYLLEKELKLIGKTHQRLMEEFKKENLPIVIAKPPEYKNLKKECLLISTIPTMEALKTDINKAIRRIKTLEFYLGNVTQKYIVYWGMTDDDVKEYLQHENIGLSGLYEILYFFDEDLKTKDSIKVSERLASLLEPA